MEFGIHHFVLESFILVALSFSICSPLPPGARSVHNGEREKTSKEGNRISPHHSPSLTDSKHSLATNPITTGQLYTGNKTSNASSTRDTHKSNVSQLKTKFDNLVHNKVQRHKAEESEELRWENQLKVRQVEEEGADDQVWKMVIIIASAIAALFSMCMFSAIFLCCCKKKRTVSTEEETDRKNLIDKKVAPFTKTKVKENEKDGIEDKLIEKKEEQKKEGNEHEGLADENSDDEADSVQTMIKAFEGKTDSPSPRPGCGKDALRPTKRRPESEAFKSFESKGILIGMGKAPKRKIDAEPEISEDDERQDKIMAPIAVTGKSDVKIPDTVKEKSSGSRPVLPELHVTTADDSDLGDFSLVKRETEVLKSHRRAAPPSGRNPMSKAAMLKARHTTVGVPGEDSTDAHDNDQAEEITQESKEVQDMIEQSASGTQISECDIKSDSDRTHDVMPKPAMASCKLTQDKATDDRKKTEIVKDTESKGDGENIVSKKKSNPPALDTSGNIFLLIDPTAKSKSMGDIAKIGNNSAITTDTNKPKTQETRIKSSSNTNQDALVSALKRKLHSSVNDDESTNTAPKDDDDDNLDPVKRERTFSEPTSPRS